MNYIKHFLITLSMALVSSYLAMALALSFPLSATNSVLALGVGVVFGLVFCIPIFVVILLHARRKLLWITSINLIGFFAILYFVYGFVVTGAGV